MKLKLSDFLYSLNKRTIRLFSILSLCLITISSRSQTASFIASDTVGCAVLTINFINLSSGASSFYWDFDDGLNSTQVSPTHIFYGTGNYNVTLYAYNSLMNVDSFKTEIKVPATMPYFNLPNEACPGASLEFTVFGNYDLENIVGWDFGDGISSNLSYTSHSYDNTGLYNVVLTVTNNNCGIVKDSNQILITNTVIPSVHIHPDFGLTTICPGENFPFYYDENYSISWDFGDNHYSDDPYPVHSYDSAGIYNVSIIVTNECGNSATLDTFLIVDSNNIPFAAIFNSNLNPCPNEPVLFSGFFAFGYNYYWDFGNGDTDTGQAVTYEFPDTGIYNIMLAVSNECENKDTDIVAISITDTNKVYGWLQMDNDELCPGGEIHFNATPGFSYYLWDFGDGDSSNIESIVHSYQDTGVFLVQLVIENGCGNTILYQDTIMVTNLLQPIANFEFNQNSYCVSDNIQFTNKSSSDAISFFWDFGDNNNDTARNPIHNYVNVGTFAVKLIAVNNCGNADTMIRIINIDSSSFPISDYTITPQPGSCVNQSIFFNNLASDTTDVLWYFGDGDSSNLAHPSHQYLSGGNFFSQLLVTNGCGMTSSSTKLVTISSSFQLEAPSLSCIVSIDTVLFSWNAIDNALSYEVSTNGGTNWITPSGPGTQHRIFGVPSSTYSLIVRAIGNANCYYGMVSSPISCSINVEGLDGQLTNDNWVVFPNPNIGIFTIYNKQGWHQTTIYSIFDIMGRIILQNSSSQNKITIDLSGYKDGIYYLKVITGNKSSNKVLIIAR